MAEMKIGDIGVLQNIPSRYVFSNNDVAEILEGIVVSYHERTGKPHHGYIIKILTSPKPMCTRGQGGFVEPYQIRKLSDPDAAQPTEQDEELEVS